MLMNIFLFRNKFPHLIKPGASKALFKPEMGSTQPGAGMFRYYFHVVVINNRGST
jgi:hypothetical protein